MRDCWCSFEFGLGNGYYAWIENVERSTLELIYIMILIAKSVISRM